MTSRREVLRSDAALAKEWYRPGKSIQEFHNSTAEVRTLVGGRGSGKTTGVGVEAIRHCMHYAGAKVLAVRQTQVANTDTSLATFNETYQKMGYKVDEDEERSLFRKWDGGLTVRIPSLHAILEFNKLEATHRTKSYIVGWIKNEGDRFCSYIEFRGLKDENKSQGQLRGYECSMMILIEADLLQAADVDLGVGCLRWKDAFGNYIPDYSMILDTNPPSPSHWIAKMEEDKKSDPTYAFWHIPTRENAHNLPPKYVTRLEKQYEKKPAHYRRYLLGQYAEVFEGSPVLFAFKEDRHAHSDLPWPSGAYLVRSWDFGSSHAVIFSAYFKIDFDIKGKVVPFEYWWELHEYYAEMSDIERQCRAVLEIMEREFPFSNDRSICAGVLDYCDPAGAQKSDKGSSVEVMRAHNIHPNWQTRVRSLDTTISIYNRLMEIKDPLGRWVYRLDKANCPRLYKASLGQYRYPFAGEPGYSTGEPIKGPKAEGADHLVDASRYGKINLLRLARRMMDEKLNPNTGPLGSQRRSLNRAKRWR